MITIGQELDGKYVVKQRLGAGGFGEVFLADDTGLASRPVAIKVLNSSNGGDQSNLVAEMDTLSRFSHPNVVAFYHHFKHAGSVCLVMEYCAGDSLDDRLRSEGGFTVEQAFDWGLALCDALSCVHAKGIVHHDIKPKNILFGADGTIKLGDFGVANMRTGTLLYMPPEMLLGARGTRTDERVDVYALGLTLLETLTGQHPFEDVEPEDQIGVRMAHGFVPEALPRWVQDVLLKATHPTPELRFQTTAEFGESIRGRHVPYVFESKRIKADQFAQQAEDATRRKKWSKAKSHSEHALTLCPDSVAALLAAGRCQLLLRRTIRASEYFSRAVAVNPRTQIQKELGWIHLEDGRLPAAISLLTDHLARNASDFEAYNLLLKCFYLTDRFEAAVELARTVIKERPTNDCFRSNELLCRILQTQAVAEALEPVKTQAPHNPFIRHNLEVVGETPRAWAHGGTPTLASKLIFEEYRFGEAARAGRRNRVRVVLPNGGARESESPLMTIGTLRTNELVLDEPSVSRRHCAIVNYPGEVWLYDLGSTVGTFVDGQRVTGRVFLEGVHDVTLGRAELRVSASSDLLL